MYSKEVALNPGTKPAELEAAVHKLGGTFAVEFPRGELQLHELVWELPDGRGSVRYIHDHLVEVTTARADSAIFGEPSEILLALSPHIELFDEDGLLGIVRTAPVEDRSYALVALGVITPELRADVFDAICDALESPAPPVRWAAMKSIAQWPYVQFVERLRAHAAREQDDALRNEAERLAADVEAHGRRGTL
jgi:hypothetical protein